MNNFFGNDWKAVPDIYPAALKDARRDNLANITITCTDNIKSRIDLWNILKAVPVSEYRSHETPLYWMDFGNTQDTGQVVLGTVPKKNQAAGIQAVRNGGVTESDYPLREIRESKGEKTRDRAAHWQRPWKSRTCSSTPHWHRLGCNILWKMFRNGMIEHYGLYLNLSTLKMNPIPV